MRNMFDRMRKRNVYLWNAVIRAYSRKGLWLETLELYYEMQGSGIEPNKFTFLFAIRACAGLSALEEGKEIHDQIWSELDLNRMFIW